MENNVVQCKEGMASTAGTTYVFLRKKEVIEILQSLEGLKHKLQPLLKDK